MASDIAAVPDSTPRGAQVFFDRRELDAILRVYGRMVAAGEWRDYAIGGGREAAVFAIFRRTSEAPAYRIEKRPELARKQGAYAVIAASGLVLRRGQDLSRVLRVLDRGLRLVGGGASAGRDRGGVDAGQATIADGRHECRLPVAEDFLVLAADHGRQHRLHGRKA